MRWGDVGGALLDSPAHHRELRDEAERLVRFFASPPGPERFAWRRADGSIDRARPLELYSVARLTHCFSVASLAGVEGAGSWAQDGVNLLLERFADPHHPGFSDRLHLDGRRASDRKAAYAHAFVVLAGSSAIVASVPRARELFDQATTAIDRLFWDEDAGAVIDDVSVDGGEVAPYRGQNANMHLAEAYLAAFEATGVREWLERARRIAERFIVTVASRRSWRVPEHYTEHWAVDEAYGRDNPRDQFRPFGSLPGHGLEWARLVLYLDSVDPRRGDDALSSAKQLFSRAVEDGWDARRGGFVYTVGDDGRPIIDDRMHWVIAEALGAAAWLARVTGEREYAEWYARFWRYAERAVIDTTDGSWWHELDERNRPAFRTWPGKPDLYHALQAVYQARLTRPCGIATAEKDRLTMPHERGPGSVV